MAMLAVLRIVMAGGALSLSALAIFLYLNPISQDHSVSVLILGVAIINLLLLYFVLKFILVDHFDFVKGLLEKLPGINFSTPVPDHLKLTSIQIAQPEPLQVAQGNSTTAMSRFDELDDIATLASLDAELTALTQDEPFTLATAMPEPAVKAPLAKAPHKANLGVDVSVLPPQNSQPTQASQQGQLQRFFVICRQLKQMNEEVAVWTEGELATLANTMLTSDSGDKDMVALLLPQRVARITLNKTFEYEFHAQVLRSIILATGVNLPISFVYSSKVEGTGQCAVNFEYEGKPVSWRFIEPQNALSKRFLKNALEWIGKRAGGKFYDVSDNDIISSYVFVSNHITQQLAKSRSQSRVQMVI